MKDSQLFYVQVCRGLTGRPYIKSLSDFEQRVLFYILFSENNNYTGIYSVPLNHIAGDCNSSPNKIIKVITKLSELNLLKYDNDIVLINSNILKIDIDSVRHNNQKLTGIKRHLRTLYTNTHSILIKEFIINNKLDEVIDEVIDEVSDDTTYTYTNTNTYTLNNKDQVIQKDQINRGIVKGDRKEIETVISYLNEKAGTAYKTTSKATNKFINARLSEGFTVDQIKQVIDKKVKQWKADPMMQKYIRPATLFNSEKFEAYLNEPEIVQQKGSDML